MNLLGCVFFGISAVAGYLVPSTGSVINLAAANLNTVLGAACFLACALATLLTGRTLKSPQLPRLHRLEADVKVHLQAICRAVRGDRTSQRSSVFASRASRPARDAPGFGGCECECGVGPASGLSCRGGRRA